MATRQKSFFDQNTNKNHHKRRPPSDWFPGNSRTTNNADNPLGPPRVKPVMAPIPASTSSRTKLKAFQFIEGAPDIPSEPMHHLEKENRIPLATTRRAHTDAEDLKSTPQRLKPQHLTADAASRGPPPSTPATRLPLIDLLGNPDDTLPRPIYIQQTPEETVGWNYIPPSRFNCLADSPAAKRKRAQSSSPAPSQELTSNLPPIVLRTPLADPAADLWDRYAIRSGVDNSENPQGAFAHLIKDSSPRSSATASSVSGLRRWASCGMEWPTSRSKRQRTKRGLTVRPEDDQPLLEKDGFRPSKLSVLIERMKETLPKTRTIDHDAPASSSPMPIVQGVTDATSPLQRLGTAEQARNMETESPMDDMPVQDLLTRRPESQSSRKTSSDYGDLDDDTLDTVNASMALFDVRQPPVNEELNTHMVAIKPAVNPHDIIPSSPDAFETLALPVKDEFDSDEDFMVADMEQLMQRYDSQVVPREEHFIPADMNAQPAGNADVPIELSDDEFGGEDDIDIDQLVAVEAAALSQSGVRYNSHAASSDSGKRAIQRYLVQIVDDGSYIEPDGIPQPEKILVVEEERTKLKKTVRLRQSWWHTNCTVGSYIHLIGQFDNQGNCVVDDLHNMIILHPDHLISATTIADSFGCLRKAVLQDRVKATSQAGPPLLYGSVLHELFQEAMKVNRWDDEFLRSTIDTILPRHYETIVEIGLNLNQVHEYLFGQIPTLRGWAQLFLRAEPQANAKIKSRGKNLIASVNKLLDVEEHVWSPMYGLKGNIDATVQVTMEEDGVQRTLTVPFELKTGKSRSESHIAQTALYTLLLSDRYDINVQYGVLYYLDGSELSRVQAVRREIIHMIMKRNQLACYVRERISLPPPLSRSHLCNRCYTRTTCFLYHKLSENGDGSLTAAKDKFKQLVSHLKFPDEEFFQKWDTLITKEEGEMMKFRRELWTMLSTERERLGRCFADLVLEDNHGNNLDAGSKINRYQYTFAKRQSAPGFSFTEGSQITVGEAIVISDEEGHFALANGYVTAVTKRKIRVAVDRRLHNSRIRQPGFDLEDNQVFGGIMEVEGLPSIRKSQLPDLPAVNYRLDKDEFSNGMAGIRNNLLQIMDNGVFKAADLRALIINDRTPRFRAAPERLSTASQAWQSGMNSDQKAAVVKVMTAEDYALVLGMPGTGKTTTIAQIIEALVAQRKSVLLTSYTHTAVDNILLKFKNSNIEILRHGNISKIHAEIQEFADLTARPKATIEDLQDSWHRSLVVATTCLGLNHPLFTQRTFDVCIVDEASQVTLPTCLGPIRMAKTFVLVGDHYQLPPLVQNKQAAEGGLDVSLFRLLSERQPQAVVSLEHQYRMCADIMMLANELIYDGRLKCGNDAVAARALELPSLEAVNKYHQPSVIASRTSASATRSKCLTHELPSCHLGKVLDPNVKVLFLNTDTLGQEARESLQGNRITNTAEVILTSQLAYLFLASGITPSELGIMTFYRSQLALLRQAFRSPTVDTSQVELHTADKFQGRDKEAVIVSCVRNNENGEVGELLKDWRRINVAITRAKSKIILIGSKATLSAGEGVLQGLIAICERQGWILDLDSQVLEAHFFPEMVGSQLDTQLSPMKPAVPAVVGPGESQSTQWPTSWVDRRQRSPLKGRGVTRMVDGSSAVRRPLTATNGNRGVKAPNNPAFKMPLKSGKVNPETVLKRKPVLRDVLNELL